VGDVAVAMMLYAVDEIKKKMSRSGAKAPTMPDQTNAVADIPSGSAKRISRFEIMYPAGKCPMIIPVSAPA